MPALTNEQREATTRRIQELFPGDRLEELCNDTSLTCWWTSRADIIRKAMYKIDCEQARSMTTSKYVV